MCKNDGERRSLSHEAKMNWSYRLESAAVAAVERSFIWNYKMKITDQCSQNGMIDISIALLENVT